MRAKSKIVVWVGLLGAVIGLSACSTGEGKSKLSSREQAALLVDSAAAAIGDGDLVAALQNLAGAEQIDPDFAPIYNARAVAYFVRKEIPQAIEEVKKAIKLDPKLAPARITLGKLLLDQGQLEEAAPHLEVAAKDPFNREAFKAYTHLGVIRYRQQKFDEAQTLFTKATELSPSAACVAFYYRGHLRLREGKFKEAIRDYSQATRKMCGGFSDAHLALATAYERSRQYDLARKKYVEIQQNFNNTEVAERAMERLRGLP